MALKDKTVKVQHGDIVSIGTGMDVLLEWDTDESGNDPFVWLTPKQARKVARALRKAARKVEASNALTQVERSFQ